MVWKSVIWCVTFSNSNLREDDTNGSSVLVLFISVGSPLFHDRPSDTTDDKEQVLATMVPTVGVCRYVFIPVDPLFPTILSELPNSKFWFGIHKTGA